MEVAHFFLPAHVTRLERMGDGWGRLHTMTTNVTTATDQVYVDFVSVSQSEVTLQADTLSSARTRTYYDKTEPVPVSLKFRFNHIGGRVRLTR